MLPALECGVSSSTSCRFLVRGRHASELLDAKAYGDVLIGEYRIDSPKRMQGPDNFVVCPLDDRAVLVVIHVDHAGTVRSGVAITCMCWMYFVKSNEYGVGNRFERSCRLLFESCLILDLRLFCFHVVVEWRIDLSTGFDEGVANL